MSAALLTQASGVAAAPDALLGTWLSEDGAYKVEITAAARAGSSTVYTGKVVWLAEPTRDGKPVHDANNSDASLRARPILGLEVLSGFERNAAGAFAGGTMYAPRKGQSFPATLTLAPDGRLQIEVRVGFLSKTVHWTR